MMSVVALTANHLSTPAALSAAALPVAAWATAAAIYMYTSGMMTARAAVMSTSMKSAVAAYLAAAEVTAPPAAAAAVSEGSSAWENVFSSPSASAPAVMKVRASPRATAATASTPPSVT